MLDGEPIVGVLQREGPTTSASRPRNGELALLFDGVRSYEEIAALYNQQTGARWLPKTCAFAANMEEAGLWYRTPQEKNLALSEKLMAQRSRRAGRKSKVDLSHISFSAWDPDRYLGLARPRHWPLRL